MELTIKLDFWFNGMDNCTEEEIKNCFITVLESGAESTCSEVNEIIVENENGIM